MGPGLALRFLHRCVTALLVCALVSASAAAEPQLRKSKKKNVPEPPPAPPPPFLLLDNLRPGPWASFPHGDVQQPPDPEAELLVKVRASYKAGVEAYQSGHLGKARTEFDRALELMLTSGLDLHGSTTLEREYDQIIDNVHSFEIAALKEGDGFTERKPVIAAIDEVAEINLPEIDVKNTSPELRQLLMNGLKGTQSDLPLVLNDTVLGYINYFSNRGRAGIQIGWRRAGRYRDMIQRIFREEGVPQDLIYLAQAESAFQPAALSRAGARGMWQFMAFTGKGYGLETNWWVDLRQDPELATRAAARHLRDLYKMFGDWYLAMAAYNSGPGNVTKAIERTGYADFWELYKRNQLPRETRNYVPIILAVTIMAKNPTQYGLTEVDPDPPIPSETVALSTPTDLRLVAETIDCKVETLQDLNPSLLRWVTPKQDAFNLRLPLGTKDRFLEQIVMIPEDKRVWWRWHRVTEGESLAVIAKSYKTTPTAIAEVNNLTATAELTIGARLVIPITPKNPSIMAAATEGRSLRTVVLHYKVRKGDTLGVVADRFGVEKADVMAWNKMKTNDLIPGRVLAIRTVQTGPATTAHNASHNPAHKATQAKTRKKGPAKGPALAAVHHSAAASR
jgi:membrane-bound lytic murein transglycosylase D